jgi:SAM-dependent methyltransferase
MRPNPACYRRDLAWIHNTGFSEFAEAASAAVIDWLRAAGVDGLVIDAGCGSGIAARELSRAGFAVLGIDASPDMIALARTTAPAARFEVASFDRATLPSCSAIVAMGEVLNYGTLDGVRTFIRNAADASRPGGLLIFDIAERGAYPPHDERRIGGEDWSVIVLKDSDGTTLTRRVLTFREVDGVPRRDEEVHQLELYAREEMLAMLRERGFRVRVRRGYGKYRLPKGHAVYIAQRSGVR